MANIVDLEVMCGKQHMEVTVSFDKAFNGIIFSKVRIYKSVLISRTFQKIYFMLLLQFHVILRNLIFREIAARYSKKTVGLRYIPSKF